MAYQEGKGNRRQQDAEAIAASVDAHSDVEEASEILDEEEEDRGRELYKSEVSAEVSRENLEKGIEKVREILPTLSQEVIGVRYSVDYYGYGRSKIETVSESSQDEIIRKLAVERDWEPLYDDQLNGYGRSSGDGSYYTTCIGNRPIASYEYSRNFHAETCYYVDGNPVNAEDYKTFIEAVREMMQKNYQERGVLSRGDRELPPEMMERVKKMRFDHRTEQVLATGIVVDAGQIKFKHGPYGSSYFGSGGGYGTVVAFDLAAWRKGERVKKELSTEEGDNGFVSGPKGAEIEPNTIIICKGGDAIGDEGRSWEEIYICE